MTVVRAFGKSSAEAAQRQMDRLAALDQLDMLDTPRDAGFDRLVRLIKEIFKVDIGIVSFIDAHRQWYKACSGLPMDEMPREDTFCRYVVDCEEAIVVQDATRDPRFASNPAVTGEAHIRFYAGVPMQTADGHTVGTVCAIDRKPRSFGTRDLSILRELAGVAMDRVEALKSAATDSLTGALTRRAFKEEATRILSQARRHNHDVSCIGLDVDHFKKVNDTYGHAAGDDVLKLVAATCREQLRGGDLLGRLGGEEFAILLPHVDREDALAVAEKLRQALSSKQVEMATDTIRVTASFGTASTSIVARDVDTLLAQADAAMYRAKQAGRDRCVSWGSAEVRGAAERRRVLKAGTIIFNDKRSTLDCTIRSLGADGANISVSNTSAIPSQFVLAIQAEGFETNCRVVAQDRQHLEVSFR
ncbi:sensor domain-containing diguanylate cyclase [Shinella sp. CPCC 101442]|uniref:sensor domain-containing diguanylate cyclase n=1 Tax=Shinella sp. CPCC 101442 TaxID=2932265 RepID=UPI0021524DE4|nr:sensor domain-containing diguanylate cyclase [Shinella sp. CPCC 101442]MCR6502156.1 sensor domain-containing diguanylate cyclase [Shinella sp. CPCC 101442]